MSKGFLPKDYEIPVGPSRYMQFEEGANQLRILGSAITGWEWWTEDEKGKRSPQRVAKSDEVPEPVRQAVDKRKKAKHFWAFPVWNYKMKEVQILELTQKTIMRGIQLLIESWGHPTEYDIIIGKVKTGTRDVDVEYSVMPRPDGKQPLDEGIARYYQDLNIKLEALYKNEDPFGGETKDKPTSGERKKELASDKQKETIVSLATNKGYAPEIIKDGLKKLYKLDSFNDLAKGQASQIINDYERAFKAADKTMSFDRAPGDLVREKEEGEMTEDEKALEKEPVPEWLKGESEK